jgi:hypothetical protein
MKKRIVAFMCTYAYEEFDEEETKLDLPLVDITTETELYWYGRDGEEEEPHKQTAPLVYQTHQFASFVYYKEWNSFKPLGEGKLIFCWNTMDYFYAFSPQTALDVLLFSNQVIRRSSEKRTSFLMIEVVFHLYLLIGSTGMLMLPHQRRSHLNMLRQSVFGIAVLPTLLGQMRVLIRYQRKERVLRDND